MDWRTIVGANIKRLRKLRDLSQENIAHDAGMDVSYLGKVERGKRNPSLKKLIRICDALDAHPGELFKEDSGEGGL